MKIIRMMILLLLAAVLLTACGDVSNVERVLSVSECYTVGEIQDAMDVVTAHFRREFDGCRLKNLRYDEPLAEQQEWARQYDADEAIVLLSDFSVSGFGGDGSLNPNENYMNWKWILTRSEGGAWKLQTWGYG